MSMFHELMMKKKEETLYPVIKGSLTESPNGVFSGFSTSNYITMPITPSELSNCSIKLRFTTANVNTEQDIIWLKRNNENIASYFGLQTHPNGNHCYMYSYAPGASSYVATSFELLSNTTYDCVINIENGKLSWKIGEPNNLIEQNQMNFDVSGIASFDNPICFGSLLNTGYAFNGSIDFNNSYIILNGTKYNLQAVVGYTVVGSPTITDGVVSGFSSANYLTLPTIDLSNPFELMFAFTTPETWGSAYDIVFNASGSSGNRLVIQKDGSNRRLMIRIPTANESNANIYYTDTNITENTKYYLKIKYTGALLTIEISTDKINWVNVITPIERTTGLPERSYSIGRNYTSAQQQWNGSIDISNTYIKANNKLVFNGQQA